MCLHITHIGSPHTGINACSTRLASAKNVSHAPHNPRMHPRSGKSDHRVHQLHFHPATNRLIRYLSTSITAPGPSCKTSTEVREGSTESAHRESAARTITLPLHKHSALDAVNGVAGALLRLGNVASSSGLRRLSVITHKILACRGEQRFAKVARRHDTALTHALCKGRQFVSAQGSQG